MPGIAEKTAAINANPGFEVRKVFLPLKTFKEWKILPE